MQNWLSAALIITIGTVAYFMFRETRATNKHNRMNTLLSLLQELGEPQSRHNREMIYDKVKRDGDEKDIKRSARTWATDGKYTSDPFEKSVNNPPASWGALGEKEPPHKFPSEAAFIPPAS